MAKRKTYGTFTTEGVRRTAYTPGDRVQMVYDGWTEVRSLDAATAAAETASAAAAATGARAAAGDSDSDDTKVKGPARPADAKTSGR